MTAQQDYRFKASVTWNPPVYPFKKPQMYIVRLSKEDDPGSSSVSVSEIISPITFLLLFLLNTISIFLSSSYDALQEFGCT